MITLLCLTITTLIKTIELNPWNSTHRMPSIIWIINSTIHSPILSNVSPLFIYLFIHQLADHHWFPLSSQCSWNAATPKPILCPVDRQTVDLWRRIFARGSSEIEQQQCPIASHTNPTEFQRSNQEYVMRLWMEWRLVVIIRIAIIITIMMMRIYSVYMLGSSNCSSSRLASRQSHMILRWRDEDNSSLNLSTPVHSVFDMSGE